MINQEEAKISNKGGENLIAKFNIDYDDVLALQKISIKHTKFHKYNMMKALFIGLLMLLFIFYVSDAYSSLTILSGIIIYLIAVPLMYRPITLFTFKRSYLKKHFKDKIGKCTLNIYEDGFTRELRTTTEKIRWSNINKVFEDEKRYFLYLTDLHAIVIKKIPENMNEKETSEYQEWLRRRISYLQNN